MLHGSKFVAAKAALFEVSATKLEEEMAEMVWLPSICPSSGQCDGSCVLDR